jgi:hypothetical protein
MPISRVRSFTVMSMMFMMTMPPTTIPMQTTAGTTVNSTWVRTTPERDQRVCFVYREIVGLIGTQLVSDPHRLLGPFHGGGDEIGAGHLHRDCRGLPASVDRSKVDMGTRANPSKTAQAPAPSWRLPPSPSFRASQADPPADGLVRSPEQLVGHVVA